MANDSFLIKAYAKINWALNVLSRRSDGYHILDMLVQRIDLADELVFGHAGDLQLEVTNAPADLDTRNNLVMKAALALKQATAYQGGARITLKKRIPSQAGLGGGSADAAAALVGLNQLWDTGLTIAQLQAIGIKLGADVPPCLCQGLMRVTGIGEEITPIKGAREYPLLLIQPGKGLSTAEVFKAYDLENKTGAADLDLAANALISSNLNQLDQVCKNQLQPVASRMLPAIDQAVADLLAHGALFAQMTGSGSVVFGVFESPEKVKQAHSVLRDRWPVCILSKTLG